MKENLTKEERLNGNKAIDSLFSAGDSFISYPLRIVFRIRELDVNIPNVRMMVSVSKKKFKRANKRNRIKRLVRESFRLNKTEFYKICQEYKLAVDISFLYLKNELSNYQEIENAMRKSSVLLKNKIRNDEKVTE